MKKIFKNPFVIFFLAVIAIIFIGSLISYAICLDKHKKEMATYQNTGGASSPISCQYWSRRGLWWFIPS